MKEKDLPIDLAKHKVYSRNASKCVLKLLHRYYDEQSAAKLWASDDPAYPDHASGH